MSAATSHRRPLLLGATAVYAVVFFSFLFWERPSLGIGHFYYIAIALVALATGPRRGAAAGALGTGLYAIDVVLNPHLVDGGRHAEGNDALQELAQLLGSSLGRDDELARVGGDEFAVLTAA